MHDEPLVQRPAAGARGDFLRRRNALWAELRALEPGDARAEPLIEELARLTRMDRAQVLAGLGWS